MFFHNFKYSLKTLIRNKILIFWTFAFPLILATFFNMAFSDIESSEKLDVIKIAVVDNEEFLHSQIYEKVLSELSNEENEDRLRYRICRRIGSEKTLRKQRHKRLPFDGRWTACGRSL